MVDTYQKPNIYFFLNSFISTCQIELSILLYIEQNIKKKSFWFLIPNNVIFHFHHTVQVFWEGHKILTKCSNWHLIRKIQINWDYVRFLGLLRNPDFLYKRFQKYFEILGLTEFMSDLKELFVTLCDNLQHYPLIYGLPQCNIWRVA